LPPRSAGGRDLGEHPPHPRHLDLLIQLDVLGQLEELRLLTADTLGQQLLDHRDGTLVVADHVLQEQPITLDEQTEAKVGRNLAQAERLQGRGETASAIDQLNNAIRLLDDSNLRDALEALVDTLQ
jgi:hypothetical protein